MTSGSPANDRSESSVTGLPGAPCGQGRVANIACTSPCSWAAASHSGRAGYWVVK